MRARILSVKFIYWLLLDITPARLSKNPKHAGDLFRVLLHLRDCTVCKCIKKLVGVDDGEEERKENSQRRR